MKTLVLDSVSSPITMRVYNVALDEFMGWFQQAPRPGFTKATVSAWRVSLEDRRFGSSSIIIRMSAIRKLAAEAADNGLLAPELAAEVVWQLIKPYAEAADVYVALPHTTYDVRAPNYAARVVVASWSRFNCCSDALRFR